MMTPIVSLMIYINTEEYNDFPEWATQIYDDSDEENIDFTEELNESETLTDKLVSWAVKFNISQTACSNLLSFLNKLHPDLPKDARSLRSTRRSVNIRNVAGGEYFYFSLQYWLSIFTERYPLNNDINQLDLHINVDGVPIFKSSTNSLWPILCLVKSTGWCPFPIAVYFSKSKPTSLDDYMEDLVSEITILEKTGF